MDWKPNIEGIDWFTKNVISKVNKNDKFKIYIAGNKMPKKSISKLSLKTLLFLEKLKMLWTTYQTKKYYLCQYFQVVELESKF